MEVGVEAVNGKVHVGCSDVGETGNSDTRGDDDGDICSRTEPEEVELGECTKSVVKANKQYRMPRKYANALKDIMVRNPDIKGVVLRMRIVEELGLNNSGVPSNFSTQQQFRRKVTILRYLQNKKKKKNYSNVLEAAISTSSERSHV